MPSLLVVVTLECCFSCFTHASLCCQVADINHC